MNVSILNNRSRWASFPWGLVLSVGSIWAGLGWSAVAWYLQIQYGSVLSLPNVSPQTGFNATNEMDAPLLSASGAALLGSALAVTSAQAAPVSLSSRLNLVGVASSGTQQGAALIGVDGQVPKPFVIGQSVIEGLVLLSVDKSQALLGPLSLGPASLRLEMPKLSEPKR